MQIIKKQKKETYRKTKQLSNAKRNVYVYTVWSEKYLSMALSSW